MTFRLAPISETNPLYWDSLEDLLSSADIPVAPDWSYQPYSEVVRTLGGLRYGRGYPIAVWRFEAITPDQRNVLRSFCADLSARVHIETATNEIDTYGDPVFVQCSAVMNWTEGEEDRQIDKTLGVEIVFTELVEI